MEGRFFLAVPNERSAHHKATSQGGGAAIFFSLLAFFAVLYVYFLLHILAAQSVASLSFSTLLITPLLMIFGKHYIFLGFFAILASPLAIIGMIDDRKHISAFWRFLTHIFFGVSAIFCCGIDLSFTSFPWVNDAITLFLIVAFINASNFSDGINGMLSGTMLVWLLYVLFLLEFLIIFLLLFAAILGFFVRNFPKGRIFLGDCGSTFLAGMILLIGFFPFGYFSYRPLYPILRDINSHVLHYLLIIFAPFVFMFFDIGLTLILRVAKGHSPLTPHKDHFMQKLLHHHKWSHKNITILYLIGAMASAVLLGFLSHKDHFLLGLLVYLLLQSAFFGSVLLCGKGRHDIHR